MVFNNTIYFLGIPRSNILWNEGYLVSLMVAEPAGYGTNSSLYNENHKTTRNQPTNRGQLAELMLHATAAGLDLRPVVLPSVTTIIDRIQIDGYFHGYRR
uniref:Uncharacterized protein n=1 Tax=Schizaphis graminum TaxID=13262 RepID=A0A2S2NZK8_SCHGA